MQPALYDKPRRSIGVSGPSFSVGRTSGQRQNLVCFRGRPCTRRDRGSRSFWLTQEIWSGAWPILLLHCRLVAIAGFFVRGRTNGALAERLLIATKCANGIARFVCLCCSMGWSRLSSQRSWSSSAETSCLRDYFPALGRLRGLGRPRGLGKHCQKAGGDGRVSRAPGAAQTHKIYDFPGPRGRTCPSMSRQAAG